MTELGERFLAALADQGYGFVFTDDDLVILGANHQNRHHVPQVVLDDPLFRFLLIEVIESFAAQDGKFQTGPVYNGGSI